MEKFDEARLIWDDCEDKSFFEFEPALLQYQLGINAKKIQDVIQAIGFFKQSLKLNQGQESLKRNSYYEIGYCYFKLDKWLQTLDYCNSFFHEVLNIDAWTPEIHETVVRACNMVAHCGDNISQFSLAEQFALKSIEISAEHYTSIDEDSTQILSNYKMQSTDARSVSAEDEEFNDDASDDSWADIELAHEVTGNSKLLLPENIDTTDDELQKFKLLPETDFNIVSVKYPKPSSLYSVKTQEGHSFMSEKDLDLWIETLFQKNKGTLDKYYNTKRKRSLKKAESIILKGNSLSKEFCTSCLFISHNQKVSGSHEACWETITKYMDVFEKVAKKKRIRSTRLEITLMLLNTISKIWTPDRDESFNGLMNILEKINPAYAILSAIIKVETYSHHCHEIIKPLPRLVDCFEKSTALYCRANRSSDKKFCRYLQVRTLVNIHMYMSDRSMVTTSLQQDLDDSGDFDLDHYLYKDKDRMTILLDLYPKIEISYMKSKASYALGLYFLDLDDFEIAEKLFFESVYILDNLDGIIKFSVPLASALGCSALRSYGDVLLKNYKYRYAMGIYDAALLNCKVRQKNQEYYQIVRHVAAVSQDFDDLDRSISLYTEIANYYREMNKINEAIYVYEILSILHLEMGYFKLATSSLQQAMELFPDFQRFNDESTPRSANFDPWFLKIMLEMSKIHLASYHWDKSIDLLEQLASFKHPISITLVVYELLTRAFIKKRSFTESISHLEQWKNIQRENGKGGITGSSRIFSSNMKATMSYEIVYYELKSKIFYHAANYPDALMYIDKAIFLSSASRYQSLGKYYFFRGKVLMRLCKLTKSSPDMKTRFVEKIDDGHEPISFKHPGDVLQECNTTFKQAYHYFKLTGDDVRIAKTVALIAELHLEYFFWPTATHEANIMDMLSMPLYEPSIVARNLREKHHQSARILSKSSSMKLENNNKKPIPKIDISLIEDDVKSSRHERSQSVVSKPSSDKVYIKRPPSDPKKYKPKPVAKERSADNLKVPKRKHREKRKSRETSTSSRCADEHSISLSTIENAAQLGLEIAIETSDMLLCLCSYLNMAELRYIEGNVELSRSYWEECISVLSQYFLDRTKVLLNEAPLSFLEKIHNIIKRATRLLFFFPTDILNKNLFIIDAYLLLEHDIDQQLKKSVGSQVLSSIPAIEDNLRSYFSYKSMKSKSISTKKLRSVESLKSLSISRTSNSPSIMSKLTSSMKNVQSVGFEEENEGKMATKENASLIWGYIHFLKVQRRKYAEGKITSEEVKNRNHRCIRKIDKLVSVARSQEIDFIKEWNKKFNSLPSRKSSRYFNVHHAIKKQADKNETNSNQKNFTNVLQSNEKMSKLVYIIQIDERIIYYVPITGYQRIQKIGKSEIVESEKPSIPTLTIQIHLLEKSDEHLTLSVPTSTSLSSLLEYMCDRSTWYTNSTVDNRKKTFFASLRPNKEVKIERIAKSKHFYTEFKKLLSIMRSNFDVGVEEGEKRNSEPLSLVSLAKKVYQGKGKGNAIVPLKSKMQKGISECFRKRELDSHNPNKPLRLYLYLSVNLSKNKAYNATIANTIHFSEDIVNYLSSLIMPQKDEKDTSVPQVIFELQQTFSSLIEILPIYDPNDSFLKKYSRNSQYLKNQNKLDPLTVICSKQMNVFPWELILPVESLLRFFSLDDVIHSRYFISCNNKKGVSSSHLSYISCYYSQGYKFISHQETVRKANIMNHVSNQLNLMQEKVHVEFSGDHMPLFPFSSQLLKSARKLNRSQEKYKNVVFIDLWENFSKPENILKLALQHRNPVFIASYCDLLEISTCLYYLLKERPAPTILFIPQDSIKRATSMLCKLHKDNFLLGQIDGPYDFLLTSVRLIREELQIPLVVVNPPFA